MPLYEYQCDGCGHRFEHIQKFSDPLLTVCPKCGDAIQKLVSSAAFQFKGTGWYVTDYAKQGSGDNAESEAEKSSGGKDAKTVEADKGDKADTGDKAVKTDKTPKTKSAGSTSTSDSPKKASTAP